MAMTKRTSPLRLGLAVSGFAALALALAAQPPEARASNEAAASPFVAAAQRGEVAPPDAEDVEHMCALLTSCSDLPLPPQLLPADFAGCVRKMADELASPSALTFSLTMRECGLRTSSCSELRRCALRGVKTEACKGRGTSGVAGLCDAEGRAITCYKEKILAVRDCPRGGENCSVRDGQSTCTLGACPADLKESAPPTCSASGTRILRCEKGKVTSLDCAAFGLKCVNGNDGASCAAATPSCSGAGKRCDGTTAVGCFNGHEVKVDCGGANMVCNPVAGGTTLGACVAPPPPGAACDPATAAKCDGATLKYCFAGKPRSYLCKSLGFAKCVSDSKGARCAG